MQMKQERRFSSSQGSDLKFTPRLQDRLQKRIVLESLLSYFSRRRRSSRILGGRKGGYQGDERAADSYEGKHYIDDEEFDQNGRCVFSRHSSKLSHRISSLGDRQVVYQHANPLFLRRAMRRKEDIIPNSFVPVWDTTASTANVRFAYVHSMDQGYQESFV